MFCFATQRPTRSQRPYFRDAENFSDKLKNFQKARFCFIETRFLRKRFVCSQERAGKPFPRSEHRKLPPLPLFAIRKHSALPVLGTGGGGVRACLTLNPNGFSVRRGFVAVLPPCSAPLAQFLCALTLAALLTHAADACVPRIRSEALTLRGFDCRRNEMTMSASATA